MKGWIALDIDGTLTEDRYSIPSPVSEYLRNIENEGWRLMLITGRAFSFARSALTSLQFPYLLSLQNGSVTLEMPSQKILHRRYISPDKIPLLEEACRECLTHFIAYTGYENHDRAYFCPSHFTQEDLAYIEEMQTREKERWVAVDSYTLFNDFPLAKFFGSLPLMKKVKTKLDRSLVFHTTLIRDPFRDSSFLLLVTDKNASKGSALSNVMVSEGRGALVIAAGDDENDLSLLKEADVKIVMPHAPENVRKIADFIAPPTKEYGIVHALKIVLQNVAS